MTLLRTFSRVHGRALLVFALAALGVQALIPAGLMVAPAPGRGAQVILCPQTHPLARAAADKASADMAAIHAAMGHAIMDHAAMGHGTGAEEDSVPASSVAPAGQSCAFAGAGALAGLLPERAAAVPAPAMREALPPLRLQALQLVEAPRLRPPLRGPPTLI